MVPPPPANNNDLITIVIVKKKQECRNTAMPLGLLSEITDTECWSLDNTGFTQRVAERINNISIDMMFMVPGRTVLN